MYQPYANCLVMLSSISQSEQYLQGESRWRTLLIKTTCSKINEKNEARMSRKYDNAHAARERNMGDIEKKKGADSLKNCLSLWN